MLSNWRHLLRHQTVVAAAAAVLLALLFAALHALGDLATYVVEAIAVALAAGIVYFLALYLLERAPDRRAALWVILLGALVFRLLLFPLAPTLSDDLHRYRWDARVQQAGLNPYLVRPDDAWLQGLRDEFRARGEAISGPDAPSIYPPLAQFVYRAAYELTDGLPGRAAVVFFKLPFLAADLAIVALVAGWVCVSGGRNLQVAVYAWNPLVVVEFAASGHNDALALAALVAATLVIIRRRPVVSTLLLVAAALAKIFPAVLFPLWLRRAGWPGAARGWLAAGAALVLAAACAWPYRSAWPGILDTLAYFESRWQDNNASLYALLRWFSGSHELAAGVGIGAVAGLALWAAARQMDTVRAAWLLCGTILLFSQNSFSWYFTWVVPFVAFLWTSRYAAPWLLLTVLQFLSYHVLIDYQGFSVWRFRPELVWLVYAPFYAWLCAAAFTAKKE